MKKLLLRLIIPCAIILLAIYGSDLVIKNKPKIKRRKPPKSVQTVEVEPLKKQTFQINLNSYGLVEPRTRSTLIPELSGRIIKVSPKFRDGLFFEIGDILLEIDPKNYVTALVIAKADLVKKKGALEEQKAKIKNYGSALSIAKAELGKSRLNLNEEEARSKLALNNWKKLDRKGNPSNLALRKPQLVSAHLQLDAAIAQVDKVKRDLELSDSLIKTAEAAISSAVAVLNQKNIDLNRTKIKVPYTGRIKKKYVDIGQFVSSGSVLAEIYATDYAEIRLPLSDDQMAFIDLPELYTGNKQEIKKRPEVTIIVRQGSLQYTWRGNIVRTEGSIDIDSQQLFVVAQINNPYASENQTPSLKIGQFVEAEIKGNVLNNVFVIPRSTLRGGNQVLIVNDSNMLSLRDVNIIWSEKENVVIDSGLSEGERLCLTPIKYVVKNRAIKVRIKDNRNSPQRRKGRKEEIKK